MGDRGEAPVGRGHPPPQSPIPPPLGPLPLLTRRPRADRARLQIVVQRRAVLPAEVDDLKVALPPGLLGEEALEVALGGLYVLAAGQAPAGSQAVDVGVHRERRLIEGL